MASSIAKRLEHLRNLHLRAHHFRPGQAPGSLGNQAESVVTTQTAEVSLLRYSTKRILEDTTGVAIDAHLKPEYKADDVTWVHIQGMPNSTQLKSLGEAFDLHPLALEDVLHREARPKMEVFDAQLFVVLNRLFKTSDQGLGACEVSFFLGDNYLISIDTGSDDVLQPVRARIHGNGRVRRKKVDYLLYALLDVVVDSGFALLEGLGDQLEDLEDEILDDPGQEARNRIHYAKRELVQMRRSWWPQREVVAALMRDDSHALSDDTRLFMRDCYDHCVVMIDFVETYREMASSLLDTYLSAISQRMNDVMKALTIIATIFLPLTFLSGLYGMNFDTQSPWNMPELHWHFGYVYVLALMLVVVTVMLVYFKRKRWF